MPSASLENRCVVVGVDGGPTAFEAPALVRALARAGASVHAALTAGADGWIGALTLETVSRAQAARLPAEGAALAGTADVLVISPLGADLVSRLCAARADDAVSAIFLAMADRAVLVPGTDLPDAEWVRANLEALGERAVLLEPGAPAEEVVAAAARVAGPRDLVGRRVLVTAGPTRERLDPVRFLTNASTGKMGYALADAARRRGAEVVLVTGPTHLSPPSGVRTVRIESAEELARAVESHEEGVDLVLAAAAVGDYRPAEVATEKRKKKDGGETLALVRTPDVLAELSARLGDGEDRPVLVGFAAETNDLEKNAREKLERKRLDLVVGNAVGGQGGAFGSDSNEVVLVGASDVVRLPRASKREVAHAILDRVVPLVDARRGGGHGGG